MVEPSRDGARACGARSVLDVKRASCCEYEMGGLIRETNFGHVALGRCKKVINICASGGLRRL